MNSSSRRTWRFAIVAALLTQTAPAPAAAQEWTWPVRGRTITPYANDNSKPYAGGMHRGIDIAAPVGADVAAAHAGRVTYAAPLGSSGLTVAVRTSDDRYITSYLHLSRIAVSRNQSVGLGQKVGEVGKTGTTSSAEPHLHFGVRLADRDNFYLDPLSLLPPLGGAVRDAPTARAPEAAPLRTQVAPVPARVRPLAVSAPRARPVAGPRPAPAPGMLTFPRRSPQALPTRAVRPVPARASSPGRVPSSAAAVQPSAQPNHLAGFVPAGPRLPVTQPLSAGRLPAHAGVAPLDAPGWDWGKLISLAGIALLAAALTRGARGSRSGAAGRDQRPKPGPRPARRARATVVRPVSQMS
jgi:murein DD-endopeptidase MepM/ murein hydrolase activator NlpD